MRDNDLKNGINESGISMILKVGAKNFKRIMLNLNIKSIKDHIDQLNLNIENREKIKCSK